MPGVFNGPQQCRQRATERNNVQQCSAFPAIFNKANKFKFKYKFKYKYIPLYPPCGVRRDGKPVPYGRV